MQRFLILCTHIHFVEQSKFILSPSAMRQFWNLIFIKKINIIHIFGSTVQFCFPTHPTLYKSHHIFWKIRNSLHILETRWLFRKWKGKQGSKLKIFNISEGQITVIFCNNVSEFFRILQTFKELEMSVFSMLSGFVTMKQKFWVYP